MKICRKRSAWLLVLMLGPGARVEGQTRDPYQGEIRFDVMSFGNFFQAHRDAVETGLTATRIEGRVGTEVDTRYPLRLSAQLARTSYHDIGNSHAVRGDVEMLGRRRSLSVSVGRETGRPTIDVGDEFARTDMTVLRGEYDHRIGESWEWKGLTTVQDQNLELDPSKDNVLFGAGTAVRYRGFGYRVSPEVGIVRGGRHAVDENEDHSENDFYVKVRSIPSPRWYLTVDYRRRIRAYSIGDPRARNFLREDVRNQITAVAEVGMWQHVRLNLYYANQDAGSTLSSRAFRTQLLTVGISLRSAS